MSKQDENAKLDDTTQIAIRLPRALLDRIESHVARLRRDSPGISLVRADAIRSLLYAALDVAERTEGTKP
jgi:hypothetical protein